MKSFQPLYRSIFRTFGYPLGKQTAVQPRELDSTEKRIGALLPSALRDYYLVAGRESRFNRSCNRFLSPKQFEFRQGHVVFLAENQSVMWWGVRAGNMRLQDPVVSQALPGRQLAWVKEHDRCSVFLSVMLHWQAVSSGMPATGQGRAPERSNYRFAENGWTEYGPACDMVVHSRPGQVVCLLPPGAGFIESWTIYAGAKNKTSLRQLGDELNAKIQ